MSELAVSIILMIANWAVPFILGLRARSQFNLPFVYGDTKRER